MKKTIILTVALIALFGCSNPSFVCNCESLHSDVTESILGVQVPVEYTHNLFENGNALVFSDTTDVENPIGYLALYPKNGPIIDIVNQHVSDMTNDPAFHLLELKSVEDSHELQYMYVLDADTTFLTRYYSESHANHVIREIWMSNKNLKGSEAYCRIYCPLIENRSEE